MLPRKKFLGTKTLRWGGRAVEIELAKKQLDTNSNGEGGKERLIKPPPGKKPIDIKGQSLCRLGGGGNGTPKRLLERGGARLYPLSRKKQVSKPYPKMSVKTACYPVEGAKLNFCKRK